MISRRLNASFKCTLCAVTRILDIREQTPFSLPSLAMCFYPLKVGRYICFIIYISFIIYKQLSNVKSVRCVRTCSRNFVCKSWCFLFTQENYLKTVVLHKIELVNTPGRYCTIHIMYFNVKMCSHNERFVKWVPNTEKPCWFYKANNVQLPDTYSLAFYS